MNIGGFVMQKLLRFRTFLVVIAFVCVLIPCRVQASEIPLESLRENLSQSYENGDTYETLEILLEEEQPYLKTISAPEEYGYLPFTYENNGVAESDKVEITSSNPEVLTIDPEDAVIENHAPGYWFSVNSYVGFEIHSFGTAVITIATENVSCQALVCVIPNEDQTEVTNITQISGQKMKLEWEKVEGCSGYIIERTGTANVVFKEIRRVSGDETTSVVIDAPWNVTYGYTVRAFVSLYGETLYDPDEHWGSGYHFTAGPMGSKLISVSVAGKSAFKVTWTRDAYATGYKLYYSNTENGHYQCIYTARGANTTSYSHRVKAGEPCYYYVVTLFGNRQSNPSEAIGKILPKSGKASSKKQTKLPDYVRYGQYVMNWACPDEVYYYKADGYFYCVAREGNRLYIHKLNSKMKYLSKKVVRLGKFDVFGGFYQGGDGNFYVALGYNNFKESRTKTVIKVQQYDSNWKRRKTCAIKGGASNSFTGIFAPFEAGSCRMDLKGTRLYLFTARKMFMGDDGVRHQSNISFEIDTRTMKAREANDSYSSHSFNQYVKSKGDDLYLVDHGDAYPRAVVLTISKKHDTDEQERKRINVFNIMGCIGSNYTGLTVGGMEVGLDNVLVCGSAQPHGYKVRGVKGHEYGLYHNIYLTVADRDGENSKVIWLTKYHPKKSKTLVSEPRMVKLSDDRFAILYSTVPRKYDMQKQKSTLHYVVVDNNGKKVYSKAYKNMQFDGETQPILYRGYIQWVASYWQDYAPTMTKSYRIPVIY